MTSEEVKKTIRENIFANGKKYKKIPHIIRAYQTSVELFILTREGPMTASPGDYVIIGIEGEIYPCKPSVFESSYIEVDEDEAACKR